MKKLALPLVIGVLVIAATGAVKAAPASTTPAIQPWTLTVGGAWFTKSHTSSLGSVGIDYAFEKTAGNSNAVIPSIYLTDSFTTTGNSGNITDLGVAVRQNFGQSGSSTTTYLGIGVSGYYVSTSNSSSGNSGGSGSDVLVGHDSSSSTSNNTTNVGGKVFGGVQFAGNWLIEADYNYRQDWKGFDMSTYGAQIGYRF